MGERHYPWWISNCEACVLDGTILCDWVMCLMAQSPVLGVNRIGME